MPVGPRAEPETSILIVDDRAENRLALRAILAGPGYRLVEASSGPEALRRILDDDFAVLLLDVVMPGMGGLELAGMIKQRDRSAKIPIVFLTAQATEVELIYQAYQVGAVDYLIKPLVPEMVRAKVSVFVDLYRQRRRIEEQALRLLEAERRESELKLLELKLADERRYRSLAEAIPHIVWTAGPDGTVQYFNRRWTEYTGLEGAGDWEPALHPDDAPSCRESWARALETQEMLQAECRLRSAQGGFRWHLCRAVPERNASGQIVSWLGTFTDIEDQKRSHQVLAEFKGTLDAVLDAVAIFEPDTLRFLYVNQGIGALLDYERDELLAMRPFDLCADLDEAGLRDLCAPLLRGSKDKLTLETQYRRKDGGLVPVELSLQYIRIDGGRVVAIARDITNRKRAEAERELLYRQALEAIRARDEFLSVASHELKTPLTSLRLQVELLLRSARRAAVRRPEQIQGKLEVAIRQVDRLARLVEELLDVSRIKTGRLALEPEEIDLVALVRDVVARFSNDAARAGSRLDLAAEGPVVGTWDRLRIEQVLTNLISNALKFGAGRPVEVTIRSHGPLAEVEVRDHGIGIAPEDVERIFHRFERAVSARAYGGLGLGLYIARQLVEAHGGTIRVDSRPNEGARFTVELPLQPVAVRGAETQQQASV